MSLSLANLPNEILALIFNNPASSHLIITLWKCGCLLLNQKLARSISEVTLVDTKVTSSSSYPKLLSKLPNLRSLDIDRGIGFITGSSASLFNELRQLPRELEKLSLFSKDAPGTYLPICDDETLAYDWAEILPELRHLKIDSYDFKRSSIMPGLPPKLKTFSTLWFYVANPTENEYPQSLESLEESVLHSYLHEGHPRRPRKRDSLSLFTLDTDVALPAALRNLIICTVQDDDSGVPEYEAEWVNCLPSSLETLTLENTGFFDPDALRRLPRTLKCLKDRIGIPWEKLEEHERLRGLNNVRLLWPPALTDLDTFNVCASAEQLRLLPTTLTSLSLYVKESIDLQALETIPCLTSLKLHGPGYDSNPIQFHHWPSSLTSLHIELESASMESDKWLQTHLPPTLQTLIYLLGEDEADSTFPDPILPAGLTYLEIKLCDARWLSRLPSTLRTLVIDTITFKQWPTYLPPLPSGLEAFHIRSVWWDDYVDLPRDCFSHLHNLHTLHLSPQYLGSQALDLPSSITDLQVNLMVKMDDFEAHLPPLTKRLHLDLFQPEFQQKLAEILSLDLHFTVSDEEAIQILHNRITKLNPLLRRYVRQKRR